MEIDIDGEGSTNGSIKRGHTAIIDTFWTINSTDVDSTLYSNILVDENRSLSQNAYGKSKLSLGAGLGRTYDITYTAVAIHIFNYLGRHNLLLNNSHSSVVRLSKVLERLKRERILDRREGYIKQIAEISNWLENEKISKPLNSYHTMEIVDLWDYAFNQKRYKGSPITAGLSASVLFNYNYSEHENTYKAFDTTHSTDTPMSKELLTKNLDSQKESISRSYDKKYLINRSITPFVHYTYNKVTGLRSQLVFTANASGGVVIEKVQDTTEKKSYLFDAEVEANYFFYPSLRSDIELRTEINYQKYYSNDTNFNYYNRDSWRGDITSKFEYYLSPKTSLVSQLSYMISVHKDSDRDDKSDTMLNGTYHLSTGVVFKFF